MTRKEEIKEMARTTASHITSDKDMQVAFADALRRGAEWADEHPKQIEISLEDIEELAKEVVPDDWVKRQDTLWEMIRRNQRAQFIDKACEWLEKKACLYVWNNCEQGEHGIHKIMLEDFRKAMKGE